MITKDISAADGLVLAMLATMVLSMGILVVLFLCMRANVARRNRQVDDLLDEVADAERKKKQDVAVDSKPLEPWEREGEWWKK